MRISWKTFHWFLHISHPLSELFCRTSQALNAKTLMWFFTVQLSRGRETTKCFHSKERGKARFRHKKDIYIEFKWEIVKCEAYNSRINRFFMSVVCLRIVMQKRINFCLAKGTTKKRKLNWGYLNHKESYSGFSRPLLIFIVCKILCRALSFIAQQCVVTKKLLFAPTFVANH